jgi:hypothetical protein
MLSHAGSQSIPFVYCVFYSLNEKKNLWTVISVLRVQREFKRPDFEPQGCPLTHSIAALNVWNVE